MTSEGSSFIVSLNRDLVINFRVDRKEDLASEKSNDQVVIVESGMRK